MAVKVSVSSQFYKKNVLVAGGVGLIGRQLVDLLLLEGANILVADIQVPDEEFLKKVSFKKTNLTNLHNCLDACNGMDYVFNLLCVKGSPKVMKERPASYFTPQILFNTCLLEAARQCGVKDYLYTSSVGVYHPAPVLIEDDVWKTLPSEKDKFAGWAKRTGELQAQAYEIQYGWKNISIARPANTYGPYDDFDSDAAMVVPSLVKKAILANDKIEVWGDGSDVRDFIHCKDVARGILHIMKKSPGPNFPVNLGSGIGCTIKELVEVIIKCVAKDLEIVWNKNSDTGDKRRVFSISRAESLGFKPEISLEDGVKDVIKWYRKSRGTKKD
jgi:GDP-L-fucose synthase